MRSEYATLNTPARVTSAGTAQAQTPWVPVTASVKNISFDRNPLVSGTPAIDAAATMVSVAVNGMKDHRPPSWRMSREWVSWSTMPAIMNSEALNVAWLSTWNTAATAARDEPRPTRKVIRPRWLTVEYASRPLRSCLKMAMNAANSTVTSPAPLTSASNQPEPARIGYRRISRNTPALTMVAECR